MADLAQLQISLEGAKNVVTDLDKIERKAKSTAKATDGIFGGTKQSATNRAMTQHQKQMAKVAQSYVDADREAQNYWYNIRKSASKVETDLKKLKQANLQAFDKEDMRLYRKELGSTETQLRRLKGKIPDQEFNRLQREISDSRRALNRHNDAIKKASSGMSKLKGAMAGIAAGAAGVAGIAYAAKRMLDYADAIGKAADRIGVATESLQEFRYAANLSGVETSKLDKGLEAFTKRLGEARQDTGALTTYLSKYNEELLKSVKNADSTEDALKMIADEMGNMESASDKAALGAAAFSRSAGVEMVNMLKKGSDGLEEMQKEARNTGAVLEDRFVRQAERTNDQLTLMSQVLKTNLARAIISMTPTILRISKAFQSWAGSLRSVLDSIVPMQLMSLEGLRDEIAETEKRIENYEKKMRQGGKLTGAWGSKLSEARKYLEDLRTEEKATEQQLKAFEEALQAGTKATGNNTEANEENAKSLDYVLTSLKVLTQAEKDRIAQLKQDQSTWEDFYKQDYLKSVMDSQEYEIMLAEEKADKMRKIAKELGKDELAVERWLREEKARIQESTADKMVEEQEQAAGETTKIYEPMINDCISCAA